MISNKIYKYSLSKNINTFLSSILAIRLNNEKEVDDIMFPDQTLLSNYVTLKDLDTAVSIIKDKILKNEHIVIVTDYDCDGVSGAGIAHRALVDYFNYQNFTVLVNERQYGNGVNDEMIDKILGINHSKKVGLVITIDHGSADDVRYETLKNLKIPIIVTDHHTIPNTGMLINVDAFINPQRDDNTFGKKISGTTVAYFLFYHLFQNMVKEKLIDKKDDMKELLPIVAITVISDQMDMRDPINRILTKQGLDILNKSNAPQWIAVKNVLKLATTITDNEIAFQLAPMLNAAGRMHSAIVAYGFYAANNIIEASNKLKFLVELNNKRKQLEVGLTKIAEKQAIKFVEMYKHSLIIVLPEGEGISGIISGKLGEVYNKPIITFIKTDKGFIGSGRGILNGINLIQAFDYVRNKDKHILIKYGGHKMAAGCMVNPNKLKEFISYFDEAISKQEIKEGYEFKGDIEIPLNYIGDKVYENIRKLAPFGNNWKPVTLISKGILKEVVNIGLSGQYKKIIIEKDSIMHEFFVFKTSILNNIHIGNKVEVYYNINYKLYNGNEVLSLTCLHLEE